MPQRGDRARLAAKPGQKLLPTGLRGLQDLDGHPAIQLGLVGTMDDRHPALPDLLTDLIVADGFSGPTAHLLHLR